MTPMSIIVDEIVVDINDKIEQRLQLCLKPKPKWLPKFIWRKLLQQLLILKEYQIKALHDCT